MVANCRGQAYDTTSSMSSSKKGVQAKIAKCAPDADYQGCCLHALNLAICHACEIRPMQNMIDSRPELYSFFSTTLQKGNAFWISLLTSWEKVRPKNGN